MAIEKEIRIKADGSGLRQLREEGLAMYRDLIGGSQQLSEEQEKSLEKLREQLQVINQKSSLDKLIGDIRSSYTGAKHVQVMPDVSDDVIQDSRQIAVDNIRQLVSDMADSFEEELKRQTDARRQMGGAISPTPDRTEEKPAPGQPKVVYDDDGNVQSLEWAVEQKPRRKRKPKTEAIEFDVDGQPVTPPPSTPVDTEGVSAGFPIPLPVQEVNPIQVPDYSDILREIADNGKPRDNARTSTDPVQEQIDFERKLMSRRAAAGLTGDSKKIDSISRTVDDLKDDDITPISSQSQEVTNVSDTGGETIRNERNARTEVVNETNVERNVNNARETVDNSHTETNNSSTIEHIAESTRNIDRNTENINETVRNVSRVNEDMKAEPVSSPEFNRTDDSNTNHP